VSTTPRSLGPSGRIARVFQDSRITPLLALITLLAGLIVVVLTPKEEEPQIDVTMADVLVDFPGASAREIESLIATPGEQVLDEIEGVEHIYSVSRHGMAVLTIQFEVGVPRRDALVRLHNQILSNQDWFPTDLGVSPPVVRARGIDDVPIMALTLFDPEGRQGAEALTRLARVLEVELKRIEGTRDVYTLGAVPDRVDIHVDPGLLAGFGLSLSDLAAAIQSANRRGSEARITRDGLSLALETGTALDEGVELEQLVVGRHNGVLVQLADVAGISRGGTVPDAIVQTGFGPGSPAWTGEVFPAVTVAVAKKPGENAVVIAEAIRERLDLIEGRVIPDDIEVLVSRDYGQTAAAKSRKLISDLVGATLSVMLLVLAAMGWRSALVVGASVIVTLLATLVFSWAWGFTLNRVMRWTPPSFAPASVSRHTGVPHSH